MSAATVHVKNISHETSEKQVRDFFSFCGKINSISVTPVSNEPESCKSATVTFEKETAAKTALLLDNTQLGLSQVQVSSAHNFEKIVPGQVASESSPKEGHDIDQEDKPRARIVAEILAHGYNIGDQTLQSAIEIDKKHGISTRFQAAVHSFDSKFNATHRAKSVDTTLGVTNKANAGWRGLSSYFEKAIGTPTGQRLRAFYSETEKQVLDIHNEARRLADLRKAEAAGGHGAQGTQGSATTKSADNVLHETDPPAYAHSDYYDTTPPVSDVKK